MLKITFDSFLLANKQSIFIILNKLFLDILKMVLGILIYCLIKQNTFTSTEKKLS